MWDWGLFTALLMYVYFAHEHATEATNTVLISWLGPSLPHDMTCSCQKFLTFLEERGKTEAPQMRLHAVRELIHRTLLDNDIVCC